jgi:hypothetical protein
MKEYGESTHGEFDVSRTIETITQPGHAELEISGASAKQFSELVGELQKNPDDSIVANIRAYNNGDIRRVIEKISTYRREFPILRGAAVVVNADPKNGDRDLDTLRRVEEIAWYKNLNGSDGFNVMALSIPSGYTWTAGLNALPALLAAEKKRLAADFNPGILYQSADVDVRTEDLNKVIRAYRDTGLGINTVRVDRKLIRASYLPDIARIAEHFAYPDDYLEQLARNRRTGRIDAFQSLAYGRNTFDIISLDMLELLGGFDPRTNAGGGMEDAQFLVRLSKTHPQMVEAALTRYGVARYRDKAWEKKGTLGMLEFKAGRYIFDGFDRGQTRKLFREAAARADNSVAISSESAYGSNLAVLEKDQDYLYVK